MDPEKIIIRNMTRSELDQTMQRAAQEGWNPGLGDAEVYWAQDPGGFWVAEQDGQVLASISAVIYDDAYAFMGFFITRPELRKQGLGLKLGLAAMARLGNRVIGQDGVVAMQDFYRRHGFELAFRGLRWQAQGGGAASGHSVDPRSLPIEELLAYDRQCFPAPRPVFLQKWLSAPGAHARAVIAGGRLRGYGVVRPSHQGHRLGPLFAEGRAEAETLLQDLLAAAGESPVFWDAPQNNPHAVAMAQSMGLTHVFETGRMYKNGLPPWRAENVYGLTCLELG
ncbi:GNAT family N-acetyltransferase [Desulfarculus baarsii]